MHTIGRRKIRAHVAAVCRGGFYQLRQLRPLKRCMTNEAIKTLTHVFISGRLDYCNVLYCGIAEGLLQYAISAERRCSSRGRFRMAGTHNSITPDLTCAAASLAAGLSACNVRIGDVGLYRSLGETAPAKKLAKRHLERSWSRTWRSWILALCY